MNNRIIDPGFAGLVPVALFGEAASLMETFGSQPGDNVLTVTDLSSETWIDDTIVHLSQDFDDATEMRAAA